MLGEMKLMWRVADRMFVAVHSAVQLMCVFKVNPQWDEMINTHTLDWKCTQISAQLEEKPK